MSSHLDPTKKSIFNTRPKTTLFCVGVVLFLLMFAAFEITFRVMTPPWRFLDSRTDDYWIAAEVFEKYKDKRNRGHDTEFDAQLGWRMKANYQADGIHHNSKGFRAKKEFSASYDGLRIAVVGDSFAYGLGVKDEETFAARLAQQTGGEVINAGVNAYGADQSYLMWLHEIKPFSPDVLVFAYFVDDFNRSALRVRDRRKPYFKYNPIADEFQLEGLPDERIYNEYGARSRLWQAITYSWRRLFAGSSGVLNLENDNRTGRNEFILAELKKSVEEIGARLIILIIGHCHDGIPEYQWIEAEIEKTCDAKGLNCINIAAEMRKSKYSSYYQKSNCHWSQSGHQFAAERIIETLRLPAR